MQGSQKLSTLRRSACYAVGCCPTMTHRQKRTAATGEAQLKAFAAFEALVWVAGAAGEAVGHRPAPRKLLHRRHEHISATWGRRVAIKRGKSRSRFQGLVCL